MASSDTGRESLGSAHVATAEGFPAIPAGRYRIDRVLDDRLREACAAPDRGMSDRAHPGFAFVIALGGMGLKIGQICELLGLSLDSGPLLGDCRIRYDRPLEIDRTYEVQGKVAKLARKPSRRFGAADHLTLRIAVSADATPFTNVELTMVIPAGAPA